MQMITFNAIKQVPSVLFYGLENRSSERLNDLPKVTHEKGPT